MDKKSVLNSVKKDFFLFPATVVQDLKMISFCRSPYERHPSGCPNWNYKEGCPPHTKPFLSLYRAEVYVAIIRMDYVRYLSLKRNLHPDWTERALRNPRHWQGHLRSELKRYLTSETISSGYQIVTNAEAMGINLFETCANAGFILEKDPKNYVCHVNLLVKPNHL